MTEMINLSVPKYSSDDVVIFKVESKNKSEKVQVFRSFLICTTGANVLLTGNKTVEVKKLYKILFDHGLSKTLPIMVSTTTYDKDLFQTIDWNPHDYQGPNTWFFEWNNVKCSITATKNDQQIYIRVHDMTLGVGEGIITEILTQLEALYENPVASSQLVIYTTQKYDNQYAWQQNQVRRQRDISTIYMNEDIKNVLVKKLKQFYESSDLYDKYGITWKRVHLFHGVPGSGKTSTVLALASMFNMNIAKLTITPELNSQNIEGLFASVPQKCVLLLEDADALFTERKSNCSIDFSTILNCMDGLTTKRGLVLFMTTNHLEKLDEAFIRPGRVDIKIKFNLPNINEIRLALNVLAKDFQHEHEEFIEIIKDDIPSIPTLQKYLFDCIMEERRTILGVKNLNEY